MDREDQRRRQRRQENVRLPEVVPLAVRAAPTERDDLVELLPQARGSVPRSRKIGNGTQVEEDRRDREVGGHGKDVPDQRRAEVGPQEAAVRIRHQPISMPDASHVDEREKPCGHDRENGHGLGSSVDGLPPRCAEQKEDRRNQRPRVRDPDPEDEGRDVGAPAHGAREPADADPVHELNEPRDRQEPDPGDRQRQERPPAQAGTAEGLQNGAVDLVERMDVRVRERPSGHLGHRTHQCCPDSTSWNVTFFK